MRAEEAVANGQAASAQALKDECEAELAEAIPALEAAIAALDTLKPADITIVKSMKSPPDGVKLVMAAVCVMKEIKPEKINDPSGSGAKVRGKLSKIYFIFFFLYLTYNQVNIWLVLLVKGCNNDSNIYWILLS